MGDVKIRGKVKRYPDYYDAHIAFHRQAELTCSIKPIYVMTGIVGEYALLQNVGIGWISTKKDGSTVLQHWGNGNEEYDFTNMEHATRFSIELITTNPSVMAGEGVMFRVHTAKASRQDIARGYKKLQGRDLQLESLGSLVNLDRELKEARGATPVRNRFAYGHLVLHQAALRGDWALKNPAVMSGPRSVEILFDIAVNSPR